MSPLRAHVFFVCLLGCRTAKVAPDTSSPDTTVTDFDGDGFPATEDCDDEDASVNPGGTEVCDGIDNDCDDQIDEDVLDVWYADADGDGFGDPSVSLEACDSPADYVPSSTDCDDSDPDVYPSAQEVCDGIDNDCDEEVDEGVLQTWYTDADGDGYGDPESLQTGCEQPLGAVDNADDCDDSASTVNPDQIEICDEIDNDCDGTTDEDDAADAPTWFADVDGDGYGDPDNTAQACRLPSGYSDQSRDCDDLNPDIHPDAAELCDLVDNDCDGLIDDADPDVDTSTGGVWYSDTDGDGYGAPSSPQSACVQPSGTVVDNTDCDDSAADINPAATEICNSLDDDCDGAVDDDDSDLDISTASTWYADTDGDGYGVTSSTSIACAAPSGFVALDGDCDDTSTDYSPGATPGCDGEDYDCDGLVDNDADLDGFAADSCGGSDCDDSDASIRPDSTGDCALGLTCGDIYDMGRSTGDGDYFIDPDGFGSGLDPFEVYCDMTTDGGGWTEIAYVDDIPFQQWFSGGDGWRFYSDDFELELDSAQIAAIQALSTEGWQDYIGRCEHVIHWYYNDGGSYRYALGFEFFDGTQTPRGQQSYAPHDITVTSDGCASNGGEGGRLTQTTDFHIVSPLVPVINSQCEDCGNTFPEMLGVELVDNPAWLR